MEKLENHGQQSGYNNVYLLSCITLAIENLHSTTNQKLRTLRSHTQKFAEMTLKLGIFLLHHLGEMVSYATSVAIQRPSAQVKAGDNDGTVTDPDTLLWKIHIQRGTGVLRNTQLRFR